MSQAHPGYVLSRQVPPSSSAFSRMTKSSHPACRNLIPMHNPANPDPITTTSVMVAEVTGGSSGWEWVCVVHARRTLRRQGLAVVQVGDDRAEQARVSGGDRVVAVGFVGQQSGVTEVRGQPL